MIYFYSLILDTLLFNMSSKIFKPTCVFLSNSSGTWQRQEGTSISSNRDGKGCMPPSAEPTAVSSNKMNLNFYKESEEANISGTENFCQHAAARRSLSYGQDAEDSGSENEGEYQVPAIVPQYTQPKASAVVDEDYDT
jgi:hypothetical protein